MLYKNLVMVILYGKITKGNEKMLQDIRPHTFCNEYRSNPMKPQDIVLVFAENRILIKKNAEVLFPTVEEWRDKEHLQYLFRIDETQYYLFETNEDRNSTISETMQEVIRENTEDMLKKDVQWVSVRNLRDTADRKDCFAAATAYHLYVWYRNNRYCGRCGENLVLDVQERMLFCKKCHNMVYPKIAPAVIVGLIHNDRILMTTYAGREYKRYALVAGFTEIGETAEETVSREVMEEVGLKVKNITYYKSQPWGFDSNLLMGFFAQLDGEDEIRLEETELASAEWIPREEAADMNDGVSLTREMMEYFYQNGEEALFKNSMQGTV